MRKITRNLSVEKITMMIKNSINFRRSVLEKYKSDGLDRLGPIKWSMALCVFTVFLLVYFSLWKGVKSAGKVSEKISIYKIVL